MNEFFECISFLFTFFAEQMVMLGEYLSIAVRALSYYVFILQSLPLYFKAFLLAFVGLTVAGMIFNRG